MSPRYPSHFEVDDAMDTAKAMGARVNTPSSVASRVDRAEVRALNKGPKQTSKHRSASVNRRRSRPVEPVFD
jgi:hypothetical protein